MFLIHLLFLQIWSFVILLWIWTWSTLPVIFFLKLLSLDEHQWMKLQDRFFFFFNLFQNCSFPTWRHYPQPSRAWICFRVIGLLVDPSIPNLCVIQEWRTNPSLKATSLSFLCCLIKYWISIDSVCFCWVLDNHVSINAGPGGMGEWTLWNPPYQVPIWVRVGLQLENSRAVGPD